VFYAIAIIITAYLPIFTLQRVEGKLFKPMAWTVVFALFGALLFSMVIAPALATFLFGKNSKSWQNPVMAYLASRYRQGVSWAVRHRPVTFSIAGALFAVALFLSFSGVIGSEFLPHLDEGAIWVRGTLAPSTGPTEGSRIADQARAGMMRPAQQPHHERGDDRARHQQAAHRPAHERHVRAAPRGLPPPAR